MVLELIKAGHETPAQKARPQPPASACLLLPWPPGAQGRALAAWVREMQHAQASLVQQQPARPPARRVMHVPVAWLASCAPAGHAPPGTRRASAARAGAHGQRPSGRP